MTSRPIPSPLASLSALALENLVVRRHEKGWTAYFDFCEPLLLDRNNPSAFFEALNSPSHSCPESFSGWIGFFGYEFLAANLGVPLTAEIDLEVPDGWFARPQSLIHFLPEKTIVESTLPLRKNEIDSLLDGFIAPSPAPHLENGATQGNLTCNLDFVEYQRIFRKAREAILDGETYQIKISQRFEAQFKINPLPAFEKLQLSNPAPEAFLLQTPEFSIISCSPEVVIDKAGSSICTRPIGGTYQRRQPDADAGVIESFLKDPKEVAEHNMLVDLERNDLSALCEYGSVRIERFREVETYSHLHHLVSTIRGRLREEVGLRDLLRAMLPGGSITGCPKIRTMEWIDRLEPCFRGPYTGSFGVIEDSGSVRLNLIIRSLLSIGEKCFVQAGGGIVVDSSPEYEFNENRIKAQALLDLLR